MSVDVSSLVQALDNYALETWDCVGENFVEAAQANAPVDTGELSESIEWSGASGGGGNVTGTVTVGAEYAFFTTVDVLVGNPYMVWEGEDGLVFAREVHPSNPTWWVDTQSDFGAIVGSCG